LRVLRHAKAPQIDQGVRHHLQPVVALLDGLKAEQEPLAFVLPRKRPLDALPQRMNRFVDQSLAPALRRLAVAGFSVRFGIIPAWKSALRVMF